MLAAYLLRRLDQHQDECRTARIGWEREEVSGVVNRLRFPTIMRKGGKTQGRVDWKANDATLVFSELSCLAYLTASRLS